MQGRGGEQPDVASHHVLRVRRTLGSTATARDGDVLPRPPPALPLLLALTRSGELGASSIGSFDRLSARLCGDCEGDLGAEDCIAVVNDGALGLTRRRRSESSSLSAITSNLSKKVWKAQATADCVCTYSSDQRQVYQSRKHQTGMFCC